MELDIAEQARRWLQGDYDLEPDAEAISAEVKARRAAEMRAFLRSSYPNAEAALADDRFGEIFAGDYYEPAIAFAHEWLAEEKVAAAEQARVLAEARAAEDARIQYERDVQDRVDAIIYERERREAADEAARERREAAEQTERELEWEAEEWANLLYEARNLHGHEYALFLSARVPKELVKYVNRYYNGGVFRGNQKMFIAMRGDPRPSEYEPSFMTKLAAAGLGIAAGYSASRALRNRR